MGKCKNISREQFWQFIERGTVLKLLYSVLCLVRSVRNVVTVLHQMGVSTLLPTMEEWGLHKITFICKGKLLVNCFFVCLEFFLHNTNRLLYVSYTCWVYHYVFFLNRLNDYIQTKRETKSRLETSSRKLFQTDYRYNLGAHA